MGDQPLVNLPPLDAGVTAPRLVNGGGKATDNMRHFEVPHVPVTPADEPEQLRSTQFIEHIDSGLDSRGLTHLGSCLSMTPSRAVPSCGNALNALRRVARSLSVD